MTMYNLSSFCVHSYWGITPICIMRLFAVRPSTEKCLSSIAFIIAYRYRSTNGITKLLIDVNNEHIIIIQGNPQHTLYSQFCLILQAILAQQSDCVSEKVPYSFLIWFHL
ncbi:hypothetical protein NP493_1049g00039 [Ridgeia piscesae]|uniref:Uncharacterized protein n=1 Tax=Ridgeia piscesae TaxID=27915 RepID=A0AAD9KIX1_RIDPI|nr:hypothetical protein NP493_1049g00039 [Ridgeia piscesae]